MTRGDYLMIPPVARAARDMGHSKDACAGAGGLFLLTLFENLDIIWVLVFKANHFESADFLR